LSYIIISYFINITLFYNDTNCIVLSIGTRQCGWIDKWLTTQLTSYYLYLYVYQNGWIEWLNSFASSSLQQLPEHSSYTRHSRPRTHSCPPEWKKKLKSRENGTKIEKYETSNIVSLLHARSSSPPTPPARQSLGSRRRSWAHRGSPRRRTVPIIILWPRAFAQKL